MSAFNLNYLPHSRVFRLSSKINNPCVSVFCDGHVIIININSVRVYVVK